MSRSTALVNDLRSRMPGLVVLAAHDPGAAGRLPRLARGGDHYAGGILNRMSRRRPSSQLRSSTVVLSVR